MVAGLTREKIDIGAVAVVLDGGRIHLVYEYVAHWSEDDLTHVLGDAPAIAAPTKQDVFGAFAGREAESDLQIGFRQQGTDRIKRAPQFDPRECLAGIFQAPGAISSCARGRCGPLVQENK